MYNAAKNKRVYNANNAAKNKRVYKNYSRQTDKKALHTKKCVVLSLKYISVIRWPKTGTNSTSNN